MRPWTDTQTDTQTRVSTIHFASSKTHAKCNNNTNSNGNVYGGVIMASHCESSPGSFGECKLSARRPPTLKPSPPTWPVNPPVGCYHPHLPSPFISITQSESCYPFYRLTFDDTRNAYAKIEYVKIPAHLKNRIRV